MNSITSEQFRLGRQCFYDLYEYKNEIKELKEILHSRTNAHRDWFNPQNLPKNNTYWKFLIENSISEEDPNRGAALEYLLNKVRKQREGGAQETCEKLNAFFQKVISGEFKKIKPECTYNPMRYDSSSEDSEVSSDEESESSSALSGSDEELIFPDIGIQQDRALPIAQPNNNFQVTLSPALRDIPRYVQDSVLDTEEVPNQAKEQKQSIWTRLFSIIDQWISRLIKWLKQLFR